MQRRPSCQELQEEVRQSEQEKWPEHKGLREKLKKRTRELNCLYTILDIVNRRGMALGERLQQVAAEVPKGWQYSENASARILYEDQIYASHGFKGGRFRQTADIVVDGQKVGIIEVYYREEKSRHDEGPFLREERDLIDAIAGRISAFIERRRAEEARQTAQNRLQEALTKMLSGFLPICAKCKKIRDNADKWIEVEVYIRSHTDAEFSHSICPQCAKELYSQFLHTV